MAGSSFFVYDEAGRKVKTIDANGNETLFQYDALNRLTATIDALGGVRAFEYDENDNLIAMTDELGRQWQYEYDNLDRLTDVLNPLGDGRSYQYDEAGQVTHITDELGRTTSFSYTYLGQLDTVTNTYGDSEQYAYDEQGNLVTYTDVLGRSSTFTYDALDRLASTTDPAGFSTQYVYDAVGNLTSLIDPLNETSLFQYDALNRLTHSTDPLGAQTLYAYDATSNLTSLTDPLGRTTTYTFDALSRLTSTTDPRGAVTQVEYDKMGNVVRYVDPLGNETNYEYDALLRLASETTSLGVRGYEYDAVGNLLETSDRNGRQQLFAYDDLNRLVYESWQEGGDEANAIFYSYDAVGNLLDASDYFSHYAFTYDDLDRVLSVDNQFTPDAPQVVLSYEYDAFGNVLSVSDQSGVTVTSEYDLRNLLSVRTWNGGEVEDLRVEMEYDARGQRSGVERFMDLAGTQRVSQSAYTHDAKGRIENISHANAIGEFLATYDYEWDMADQLLEWTHHGQTTNYAHDDAGQLTAADSSALPDGNYAYDLNGNRDNPSIVVGDHNQLLADETYDYSYDAEGNLLTKTERATGTLTTYTYDHRNRLTSAETYTSGGILLSEVSFTYDLFNRRIAQTVNGQLTHFVYDGSHVWADFDSTHTTTARYLFGDTTDQLLSRFRPTDGTACYLTDHLGTVRDLTDSTGTLRSTLSYDSFGLPLSSTDPTFSDRYQFTAREYLPELELYYYRARFYDPATGRFLSQDPIGFAAGDANLYRYVLNSPTKRTDYSGYFSVEQGELLSVPAQSTVFLSTRQVLISSISSGGHSITASVSSIGFATKLIQSFGIATVSLLLTRPDVIGGMYAQFRIGDLITDALFEATEKAANSTPEPLRQPLKKQLPKGKSPSPDKLPTESIKPFDPPPPIDPRNPKKKEKCNDPPRPLSYRQVPYALGTNQLVTRAITYRAEFRPPAHKNVATLEYCDKNTGIIHIIAGVSRGKNDDLHAEQVVLGMAFTRTGGNFLPLRLYSELAPCLDCIKILDVDFRELQVMYSWEYDDMGRVAHRDYIREWGLGE